MFVVRATLGDVYVADVGRSFRRPPCTTRGCYGDRCRRHMQLFDSISGIGNDRGQPMRYREFVIYERQQSYPEYLVQYRKVASNR